MAKIAFILLCHKDPEAIIAQAERLTATGDFISIHFDASASAKAYTQITETLADNPNITFAKKRVKCGWGEWSLVRATLNALEAAEEDFPQASHFYMLSGDCMPVKSAAHAHAFLDARDIDYCESFDFFTSGWIKTGMKEDRLRYRHYFNERTHKRLFYTSLAWQRKLGLTRDVPKDLEIMIGSQWWCLRRRTVEAILSFVKERPDVLRFFSTTWIPDETFFQTLVRHLVPREEIESRTLTFLVFTDYGMPATFYNDQFDLLTGQDFLFARKISPEALELKEKLGNLWASERTDFPIAGDGRRLFTFLTGRGRIGRRFAPRFWERESSLGRDRSLLILISKKWHVAKRLSERIENTLGIKTLNYLFDEEDENLPDLGGIQSTLAKRNRHRRALMRMLYEYHETNELIICLDPSNFDLLADFYDDSAQVRTLQLVCHYDDDYLTGHAKRVGLASENTAPETLAHILPTLRYDFSYEIDRIREAEFEDVFHIPEGAEHDARTQVVEAFLRCGADQARDIADIPYLFED